jgi:hypothetical protein
MVELEKILFAELTLSPPPKSEWLKSIEAIDENYWFHDDFRRCDLLPLFTEFGQHERLKSNNSGKVESLDWVTYAPRGLVEYAESEILPWLEPNARFFLIRTLPLQHQNPHIDCYRDVTNQCQLKMRLVLQGDPTDLVFLNQTDGIRLPNFQNFFIMDGAWPHVMTNSLEQTRYVLALGTPWQGQGLTQEVMKSVRLHPDEQPEIKDEYFFR